MRAVFSGVGKGSRIALAATVALLSSCTLEQVLIGQSYFIYTPPAGGCPSLALHFVVDAQRMLHGSLSGPQTVANLSGVLNPDDTFQLTATNVASSRTAEVTGQFTSLVSTISIRGDALGSGCDGQTLRLRLGGYFARSGGGGGGGG